MKAILRWGASLVGLLLVSAVASAYYWVTPVLKCPYPVAPSPCNGGFYLLDSQGRWTGPHYYLVPPCRPFNGILPGKTGGMIMAGNLPHTWLMSKEGLSIGNVPMVGGGGPPQPPYANPTMPTMPPMRYPMQSFTPMPNPMPAPYPMPIPYPVPIPYPQSLPYPQQRPMMPPAASGNPLADVWLAQNTAPNVAPFAPIPNYQSTGTPNPLAPPNPMVPQFGPMQPFAPFTPMQGPQMGPINMQMPRMDMAPPPSPHPAAGNAFPMHPFTRSPRDFFMWGESIEDEERLRARPYPVPR
jgi:hypothetical protein